MPARRGRGGARVGSRLGTDLVTQALATLPDVDTMIDQGFSAIRARGFTDEKARTEFGRWMVEAHKAVAEIHREAEANALDKLIDLLIARGGPPPTDPAEFSGWFRNFLRDAAREFVAFEFRSGQARKSRAGSVWEKVGTRFLEMNGIPCEKPTGASARRLRQIDRVVPSVQAALETADRAIGLSFKTESREKWRVLIDENRRGYVYLVTLGDDMTPDRLREMADSRLVVFVPAEIKGRAEFKDKSAIRSLDDLPSELRRYIPAGPRRPRSLMVPLDAEPDESNG